ncbi:MAG: DUF962 domain-containing protein [Bacteroidia bacterium]|nr:DUF962 domain-containing protein [Bacteroidia bacterium]
MAEKKYKTFWSFYNYYLTEHSDTICRGLHFFGTFLVLVFFVEFLTTIYLGDPQFRILLFMPLAGYGFAWFGHFFFEKNKPATFTYPLWSLGSDFVMFWHILSLQLPKRMELAKKAIASEKK